MKGKKQIQFTAAEMEIFRTGAERICRDFEVFCKYMMENQVKLSFKTGNIGKKDCFKINQLLSWREDYEKESYSQDRYAVIHFFLHFAFRLDLLASGADGKSGILIVRGRNYDAFTGLPQTARYLTFFSYLISGYFMDQLTYENMQNYREMAALLNFCAVSESGTLVPIQQKDSLLMYNAYSYSSVLRIFQVMNILDTKFISKSNTAQTSNTLLIESAAVQEMGNLAGKMFESCKMKDSHKLIELVEKGVLLNNFIENLSSNFAKEESEIMLGLLEEEEEVWCQQVYKLEISLRGYKCRRTIRIGSSATLEELHNYIQELYDFDDDHLYSFTIGIGRKKTEFFRSEANEENSADEVTLGELGLFQGQSFTYLFDFGDCWEFTIKVKDIQEGNLENPETVSAVGEPPQQYPDWDDDDWE